MTQQETLRLVLLQMIDIWERSRRRECGELAQLRAQLAGLIPVNGVNGSGMSSEARAKISEGQKARWAKRKAADSENEAEVQ